jgi:hypothetical protein
MIFTDTKNRVSVCPHLFTTRVPFLKIVAFTAFQFLLVGVIFGVTLSPAAISFPLFILVLIPIRRILLKRWFGDDVIGWLDADDVCTAGEDDEGGVGLLGQVGVDVEDESVGEGVELVMVNTSETGRDKPT